MQRLGLLTQILPEFSRIDSLVVLDFYHRYNTSTNTRCHHRTFAGMAAPPDEQGAHFGLCGGPSSAATC